MFQTCRALRSDAPPSPHKARQKALGLAGPISNTVGTLLERSADCWKAVEATGEDWIVVANAIEVTRKDWRVISNAESFVWTHSRVFTH